MIKRTDKNHVAISNIFRQLFYSVKDTSMVGGGFGDLVVAKYNRNYIIEIKTDEGELNKRQRTFADTWNTKIYVVKTTDDVINLDKQLNK